MKLATRVSAFFLAAVAVILIGNSVLVFAVARLYLHRHFDEQLQASLQTLVAAVEVEDDDVKWEPSDHTVTLGVESGEEDIRWVVTDERGQVVDRSRNLRDTPQDVAIVEAARGRLGQRDRPAGWRFLEHRLAAPHPKAPELRDPLERAALSVLVARDVSDLHATLRWLAAAMIVLPACCWLAAALAGRWFCQQAIAPVRQMARSARSIRADDTLARLAVPSSGDELQELGEAFNELLDQLFVGYERQQRFAGDAAHQFRTPLTVLQGQVEVALRRQRSADEYQATLNVVHEQVASLRQTVEALLFLARPSGEEPLPDFQAIDVAAWLDAYLLKWQGDPRWPDVRVEVEPGLACNSSPGLLAQLLDVLLSNALKYSQPGSPVEVRARAGSGELLLEVADRGIGISAADLESIYQPFFRARQARQSGAPGIGLGLAIARRIATALGGCLRCESEPAAGSRFTVALPAVLLPTGATCVSSAAAAALRSG